MVNCRAALVSILLKAAFEYVLALTENFMAMNWRLSFVECRPLLIF